ncbi:hypothetical protein D9758_008697 [Tetrapyrgos nigripes]|uniref:Uncharacterized protein n=1 Tax=Tetrapyrgos nigripes TaxID=182062 RepID=A0A8H5D4Z0_9AGAR|nr:hypothetical protein D9758_008697 [Tetrapyrgos nigripes]
MVQLPYTSRSGRADAVYPLYYPFCAAAPERRIGEKTLTPIPCEIYNEIFSHIQPEDELSLDDCKRIWFALGKVCWFFCAMGIRRVFESVIVSGGETPKDQDQPCYYEFCKQVVDGKLVLSSFTSDVQECIIQDWVGEVFLESFWRELYGKAVRKMKNITALSIVRAPLIRLLFGSIRDMANLQSLSINACPFGAGVTVEHVKKLRSLRLKKLEVLSMDGRLPLDLHLALDCLLDHLEEFHTDSWLLVELLISVSGSKQIPLRVLALGPMDITRVGQITLHQYLETASSIVELRLLTYIWLEGSLSSSALPNLRRVQAPINLIWPLLSRPSLVQLDWAARMLESLPTQLLSVISGQSLTILSVPWTYFIHPDDQKCFPHLHTLTLFGVQAEVQVLNTQNPRKPAVDLTKISKPLYKYPHLCDLFIAMFLLPPPLSQIITPASQTCYDVVHSWNLDAWCKTITDAFSAEQFPCLTRFALMDCSIFEWRRDHLEDGWKSFIPHRHRELAGKLGKAGLVKRFLEPGGTNTDGVILDIAKSSDPETRGIVAFYKHATTVDVTDGIEAAVKNVLDQAGVDPKSGQVLSLTIGTTSDARRLSKVAIIRLAAPYTVECPSFIDFPPNLKRIMDGHTAIISGGHQIDGRHINKIVEAELVEQATQIRAKGLKDVVLVGVFSPLDLSGAAEYDARVILRRELGPHVNIVCSRDVGQLGLLERENASILNASITSFAQRTIRGFENAMARLGLTCPLYITQNDGTLTSAAEAARLPIKTFSSGATNSMRGGSYLAGMDLKRKDGTGKSMLVADVGGTTTDVGVLLPSGFPRQAAAFIEVGGVRTNFAMPDINSIGLGGGSRVRIEGPKVTVGPDSVGHYLTRDGKVFGGDILTATDISVRGGVANVGDRSCVADVSEEVLQKAKRVMKRLVEVRTDKLPEKQNVVDQMKTSPEDCSLLLVGGGSIIVPPQLDGVKEIIVANAVGAAIANVSGEIDTIEILQGKSLDDTLARIKMEAIAKAVEGGADPATVRIAEINVLPVQYVTNQATRIIVRAVGEIGIPKSRSTAGTFKRSQQEMEEESEDAQEVLEDGADGDDNRIDYETYRPKIVGDEWHLSETDLFFIMEGCGILGTGGGGSPYPTFLMCRQVLRNGGSIRIIDHTSIPDDGYVVRGLEMGSPSVSSERIMGGAPIMAAGKELAGFLGAKKLWATVCDEIGGGNGMKSLLTAPLSKFRKSNAFAPQSVWYTCPGRRLDGTSVPPSAPDHTCHSSLSPCSLHDGDGNIVILSKAKNDFYVESLMRTVTTEMGSSASLCGPPLHLRDARDYGVPRCHSQAWRIGRAVAMCRQKNDFKAIPAEILKLQTGACLFIGKITNVNREVRAGFTWGEVRIARLFDDELEDVSSSAVSEEDAADIMVIPFQNENLVAYIEKPDGSRRVAAIVPDLITVLDSQSGSHLGTQMYSYGLRVTVIALAGSPLWTTEVGLKTGGPSAFGINEPYVSIGEYLTPRSVIEEYK